MPHKVTIEIETGNAAFEGDEAGEVGRILIEYGRRLMEGGVDLYPMSAKLYDINGNPVGGVSVTP